MLISRGVYLKMRFVIHAVVLNKKSLTAKMFIKNSIFGSKAIFIYFDFLKDPLLCVPRLLEVCLYRNVLLRCKKKLLFKLMNYLVFSNIVCALNKKVLLPI